MEKFKNIIRLHWLMVMVAALAMSVSFSSCGDDDDDDDESGISELVGTWQCSVTNSYTHKNGVRCYCFNSDGSGYYFVRYEGDDDSRIRYDYMEDYCVSGGHLLIRWEDDDEYDDEGEIRDISESTFRIRYDEDEDWLTFRRVK